MEDALGERAAVERVEELEEDKGGKGDGHGFVDDEGIVQDEILTVVVVAGAIVAGEVGPEDPQGADEEGERARCNRA